MPGRHEADVLDERPAERHVEHLDAPAHAEDRQAPINSRLDQSEIERVTLGLGGGEPHVRLLVVTGRLDVASGRQHDRVDDSQRGADRVDQLRQRHRQAAGVQYRSLHAHAAVVAEVVKAGGDADQGRSRHRSSTQVELY